MFGYAPQVTDRSGELQAAGTLAGSQALSQGISQAGQYLGAGITGANAHHEKIQMAQGTLTAAQGLVNQGYMDQATLDAMRALPADQMVGASASILPMLQAAGMMEYHKSLLGIKQQGLDAKASTGSSQLVSPFQ